MLLRIKFTQFGLVREVFIKKYVLNPRGLAEAPRNHSDLAKIEEKGGYIAPETPPGCL